MCISPRCVSKRTAASGLCFRAVILRLHSWSESLGATETIRLKCDLGPSCSLSPWAGSAFHCHFLPCCSLLSAPQSMFSQTFLSPQPSGPPFTHPPRSKKSPDSCLCHTQPLSFYRPFPKARASGLPGTASSRQDAQ